MKNIFVLLAIIVGTISSHAQSVNKIEGDTIKLQARLGNKTVVDIIGRLQSNGTIKPGADTTIYKQGIAAINGKLYMGNGTFFTLLVPNTYTYDSITSKPANFTTTYALSNDVKDSIQNRAYKDGSNATGKWRNSANSADSLKGGWYHYSSYLNNPNSVGIYTNNWNIDPYGNFTLGSGYIKNLSLDGVSGNGYLTSKNQYINPTGISNYSTLYTGSDGRFKYLKGNSATVYDILTDKDTAPFLNRKVDTARFAADSIAKNTAIAAKYTLDSLSRFGGLKTIFRAYSDSLVAAARSKINADSIAAHNVRIGANTSNIATNTAAIATKLNTSDSSIYQSKFRSDTARSNIYNQFTLKLDTGAVFIKDVTITNTGVIHNAPSYTYNAATHSFGITQTLATQTANTVFGTGNATATPTFRSIDSNYFGGTFQTQVRAAQIAYTLIGIGGIDSIRQPADVLYGNANFSKVNTTGISNASLNSQTANTVFAAPDGSSGAPTFRSLVATDIPTLSYLPIAGGSLIGTGGAGFVGFIAQSATPTTPSSGFRLFAESTGRLAWVGTNGFTRILDGGANTANQTYTLPNATGTIPLLSLAQTFSALQTFSSGITTSGAVSAAAWGVNGVNLKTLAATYTDNSTAASATVASNMVNTFGIPTLASTNTAVTYTNASTVYIAGAVAAGSNTTITNPFAFYVNAGNSYFGGLVTLNGSIQTSSTNPILSINNSFGSSDINFNASGTTMLSIRNTGANLGIGNMRVTSSVSGAVGTFFSFYSLPVMSGTITVGAIASYQSSLLGTISITGAANIIGYNFNNNATVTNSGTGVYAAFVSTMNTGTGFWNLYMSGTANNYLAGKLLIGTTTDAGNGILQVTGNLALNTAGSKILVATGSNASAGTATLVSGTVTISTTAVTANSLIFVEYTGTLATTSSVLNVSSRVAGTSFTVTAFNAGAVTTNTSDANSIKYWIIN